MITQKITQDLKVNVFNLLQNPEQRIKLIEEIKFLIDDTINEVKMAKEIEARKNEANMYLGQFLDYLEYFGDAHNKAALLTDERWKKKVTSRLDNIEADIVWIDQIRKKYNKSSI